MSIVKKINARMILDSRGNPTVEVDVITNMKMGRAAVPSGASTGSFEAVELRDGEKAFHGKGVEKAIYHVNKKIAPRLIEMDASKQRQIDAILNELDGTPNKSFLGANAILGVSMAVAKAEANSRDISLFSYLGGIAGNTLPVPSMNVINGGEHAGNELNIQEHMILPCGAGSFSEAIRMGSEIYHQLGKLLKKKYGKGATNVGDEGGFAPPIKDAEEPFEIILQASEELGYQDKVMLGMDAAASEFYHADRKRYEVQGTEYSSSELVDFYKDLAAKYPIISIEDPFSEDDWDGFKQLTAEVGEEIQIVGDDLLVTNMERLKRGIEEKAANALLLKLNQIGTVTEAWSAGRMSLRNNWGVMVSHRSGETEDTFISDLVVALNAGQIKAGAPARTDRTAKYNQLLRIEEELGKHGRYAGADLLK